MCTWAKVVVNVCEFVIDCREGRFAREQQALKRKIYCWASAFMLITELNLKRRQYAIQPYEKDPATAKAGLLPIGKPSQICDISAPAFDMTTAGMKQATIPSR